MSTRDELIKLGTTNPNLRPHIRPVLVAITASRGAEVELTTNPQEGHGAWPNVTWNGRDVFDAYHVASGKLKNDLLQSHRKGGLSDLQEVYLGYAPNRSIFVIGFDAWFDDKNGDTTFGCVFATWHMGLRTFGEPVFSPDHGFYDVGHNLVQHKYPNIVDLRLD